MWIPLWVLALSLTFLSSFQAKPISTVKVPSNWINNLFLSAISSAEIRPILSTRIANSSYGILQCGFICISKTCDSFVFGVLVSAADRKDNNGAQIIWSATNAPVRENATLQLTGDGGLLLHDANGTLVWSTNTTNMSIADMSITDKGNLILRNQKRRIVWQSFDYPTNNLLPGQGLVVGQALVASTNRYWMSLTTNGLAAFVDSDPPQMYYLLQRIASETAIFVDGVFKLQYRNITKREVRITLPPTSSPQFLRLDKYGHFMHYEWLKPSEWHASEVLNIPDCNYPLSCGLYGICSDRGQCACPGEPLYFKPVNDARISLGCKAVTPLSCEASKYHSFLTLPNIAYFNYVDNSSVALKGTDMDTCQQACLRNCSCKAAMFRYQDNETNGDCFTYSQVFTLKDRWENSTYNSSISLKVQQYPQSIPPSIQRSPAKDLGKNKSVVKKIILYATCGSIGAFFIVISFVSFIRIRKPVDEKDREDSVVDLPEMPIRFTYEELTLITHNFVSKLGEGGFGSVFKGSLSGGTKVAVKRLEGGVSQGRKQFMAEIRSIGSIHHINLVRLIGYCAENSHRLLVYEYMPNGSLDKWIYESNRKSDLLSWKTRKRILLGIAKGLEYLHEHCQRRIIHLDIKPQNILLDENFDAKVSDFGLSKLIDRDRSQVMTTVRGTLGYLAPEWLGPKIDEKVDVYSFGVVVLEIVCGRRVLDYSKKEEDIYLLNVLKSKAEEGQLSALLNKNCQSEQLCKEEALRMMKVAVWCLQGDTSKRPSMSMVVQALDGMIDMDDGLNYSFLTIGDALIRRAANVYVSAPQISISSFWAR